MIYAYDTAASFPVADLYDSLLMELAISAAKDTYEKGEKRIEDFYTKYGDFMSPFSKDMDKYGQMINNITDKINWMYDNGIDPLRSPEGLRYVTQLTRSINPAEFNTMRTNAKIGFEYLKNIEEAKRNGTYDEDYEKWRLSKENGGPGQFADFSSANGMWNITGPGVYKDPNTLVSPLFEGMEDSFIDSDDQYDYYGIDRDRRALILLANLGALLKTPEGKYQYEIANREYERRFGPALSEGEKLSRFLDYLLDASDRFEHRNRKENAEYARLRESQLRMAEDDHSTENDIYAHQMKKLIDSENTSEEQGYSTAKDVHVTTIATAAGMSHLPAGGLDPTKLTNMMRRAVVRQNRAVLETGDVLKATGMFIDPDKISGLIPYDDESNGGYFLNPAHIKDIRDLEDIRSSYIDWGASGKTQEESAQIRKDNKNKSKTIIDDAINYVNTNDGRYRLKVIPIPDANGNNVYAMMGDDNRWHTYIRARILFSDGDKAVGSGSIKSGGITAALEVGLRSNENAGTPDLSLSEMERVGTYPFRHTKKIIGLDGNKDFPYSNNTLND